MNKIFIIFSLALVSYFLFTGQSAITNSGSGNPDPRMTRIQSTGDYVPLPQVYNKVFSTQPRVINSGAEVLTVFPNFRVHPSFGSQSETPICRHPFNPLIMFASANTFYGGSTFSTGVYVTTNGGDSWYGSDTIPTGVFNYGDPAPVIDKDGRFLMTYIALTGNMGSSFSTDNGITWSPNVVIPGSSTSSDKNFTGTDDIPTSPYYGRSYIVYTEFAGQYFNRVVSSYTTNGGANWSNVAVVSPPLSGNYFHQGADIKIGPDGDVFVVWANNIGASATEDSLGIARSTDGGVSWVMSRSNADNMNGIRNSGQTFMNGIRANGFPRIDIDRTNGSRRGWIYVATAEKNVAPATDVADVILHRSTDKGVTWTSRRVNQDTPGNGKYQYMAAVNVDDQGGVNVIYYDTRNTPTNDSAQVYVSRSLDGGNTWEDILVSDHKFRPKSISGLAAGYQGDYIGITSGNANLWPYWCDDIEGIYQAWTCKVSINLTPLNNFNLAAPSAGTTITSYPNSSINYTFNWDTSTSLATYKWIFGSPSTTPRKFSFQQFSNSMSITAANLDTLLASYGLNIGDSLVGQWDVWAFRNNLTQDSLKASNGPRAVTLKRGIPPLTSFNLYSPSDTTINTSSFDFSNIKFRWASSGPGTTYKWKFGSPSISSTIRLAYTSSINGIDSSFTIANQNLDGALAGIGVSSGDSISGEWSVWAYNGFDSAKASQNIPIKFKRKSKGEILVLYDSTNANCRISRDSVIVNLNRLNKTYELYNRKGVTATDAISFRGFKRVMVLGEGSSVMSNKIKDSLKAYISSGTGSNKARVIILSEDIGYHLDRIGGAYYDSAFARSTLGISYVADRPGVGGKGIIGISINTNLTDSSYGPSTDVIKKSASVPPSQQYNLYRFRLFADSMCAIGRISPNFNVAVMSVDVESMRSVADNPNPFTVKRILDGMIKFVDEIPTGDPNTISNSIPLDYSMSQNYPNPFNPTTKIRYNIPVHSFVSLKVFDVLGKEVLTLVSKEMEPGSYDVEMNAAILSSGIYFYQIKAGNFVQTRRMMLLK